MALRVLLADNSETIKRVIQLALEEFGVEVRSVNIGVDVVNVAKTFKPDLVFADILLQKRNGYEVTADLKKDPVLKDVPVILMWSGFMELDEVRAEQCGAEGRLEKPFDSDRLRLVVQKVMEATGRSLSGEESSEPQPTEIASKEELFSSPPPLSPSEFTATAIPGLPSELPNFGVSPKKENPPNPAKTQPPESPAPPDPEMLAPMHTSSWNMDSFEEIPKFDLPEVELSPKPTPMGGLDVPEIDIEGLDDSFQAKPLSPKKSSEMGESPSDEAGDVPLGDLGGGEPEEYSSVDLGWEKKSLSQFKLKNNSNPSLDDINPVEEADQQMVERVSNQKVSAKDLPRQAVPGKAQSAAYPGTPPVATPLSAQGPIMSLTREELEELVREQSREVLQEVVWKLVPDIASDLIKKEIRRLLDESP